MSSVSHWYVRMYRAFSYVRHLPALGYTEECGVTKATGRHEMHNLKTVITLYTNGSL